MGSTLHQHFADYLICFECLPASCDSRKEALRFEVESAGIFAETLDPLASV